MPQSMTIDSRWREAWRSRGLLTCIALELAVARLRTRFVPARRIWPTLTVRAPEIPDHPLMKQLSRLIPAVARRVPWRAMCLEQAITAHTILARAGIGSRVEIGVAHGPFGKLEAHAWLKCAERTVVGGRTAARFVPLSHPVDVP